MRPTKKQIIDAVGELGMLQFFPSDPVARAGIMKMISRMVETKDQLDWLVATMIDRVGEWKGPKELRGVFCSRFRPQDGIEGECGSTPGFTASELEASALMLHESRKAKEIAASTDSSALIRSAMREWPK